MISNTLFAGNIGKLDDKISNYFGNCKDGINVVN